MRRTMPARNQHHCTPAKLGDQGCDTRIVDCRVEAAQLVDLVSSFSWPDDGRDVAGDNPPRRLPPRGRRDADPRFARAIGPHGLGRLGAGRP